MKLLICIFTIVISVLFSCISAFACPQVDIGQKIEVDDKEKAALERIWRNRQKIDKELYDAISQLSANNKPSKSFKKVINNMISVAAFDQLYASRSAKNLPLNKSDLNNNLTEVQQRKLIGLIWSKAYSIVKNYRKNRIKNSSAIPVDSDVTDLFKLTPTTLNYNVIRFLCGESDHLIGIDNRSNR